jgi:hypothetical protein
LRVEHFITATPDGERDLDRDLDLDYRDLDRDLDSRDRDCDNCDRDRDHDRALKALAPKKWYAAPHEHHLLPAAGF